MGMYAHYWCVTPQEWQHIKEDAAAADAFFGYNLDDADDNGWNAYFELRRSGRRYLDIERAWDGLHFLLTGRNSYAASDISDPLSYVVGAENEHRWNDDCSVDFLRPEQVQETSHAMKTLPHEDLRSRYDAAKFSAAELYPSGEWHPEDIEPLLGIYDKVAAFFHAAAEAGDVILIQVS